MKKAFVMFVLMLGMVFSASAIKVHAFLVGVIGPECVRVLVVVTDNNMDGDEYVVALGIVDIGGGCGGIRVETPPKSPNDFEETMKTYPEIQRYLDDWYLDYIRQNPPRN